MKLLLVLFQWVHKASAILFGAASLVLFVIAAKTGAEAIAKGLDGEAAQAVIEAVGLMAAAVVALQISETIIEEEVIRDAHVSAPTRVRRFLSRFFVVVIVALVIEGLVATFKAIHEQLQQLVYAGALLAASALLLAGWGVFIYLNRFAEDVEPEAMEEAKREDAKVNG
jgi:cellobiose-specific phosphotransferase system component IIC